MSKKDDEFSIVKETGLSLEYQVSIWVKIALVFPMSCLAFILLANLIGLSTWTQVFSVLIITAIVIIAIIWWWWALFTILKSGKLMVSLADSLNSIQKEIIQIRKNFKK